MTLHHRDTIPSHRWSILPPNTVRSVPQISDKIRCFSTLDKIQTGCGVGGLHARSFTQFNFAESLQVLLALPIVDDYHNHLRDKTVNKPTSPCYEITFVYIELRTSRIRCSQSLYLGLESSRCRSCSSENARVCLRSTLQM